MAADSKWLRIGELAEKLGEPPHVIRFWEQQFGIKAERSAKGQRVYRPRDVAKLMAIQELLRKWQFTIAGAKAQLRKAESTPPLELVQSYLRAHRG